MKFMNQVGDGTVIIEDGNVIADVDDNDKAEEWAQEFSINNKQEETLDEKWANEFVEPTAETGIFIVMKYFLN